VNIDACKKEKYLHYFISARKHICNEINAEESIYFAFIILFLFHVKHAGGLSELVTTTVTTTPV